MPGQMRRFEVTKVIDTVGPFNNTIKTFLNGDWWYYIQNYFLTAEDYTVLDSERFEIFLRAYFGGSWVIMKRESQVSA